MWFGDTNCAEKVKPPFSIFLAQFLSPIESPCDDCNGAGKCVGGWVTKIVPKKSTYVFDFLARFSLLIEGPAMIVMEGSVWVIRRRKSRPQKLNRRFRFFRCNFRHPSRVLQ